MHYVPIQIPRLHPVKVSICLKMFPIPESVCCFYLFSGGFQQLRFASCPAFPHYCLHSMLLTIYIFLGASVALISLITCISGVVYNFKTHNFTFLIFQCGNNFTLNMNINTKRDGNTHINVYSQIYTLRQT